MTVRQSPFVTPMALKVKSSRRGTQTQPPKTIRNPKEGMQTQEPSDDLTKLCQIEAYCRVDVE